MSARREHHEPAGGPKSTSSVSATRAREGSGGGRRLPTSPIKYPADQAWLRSPSTSSYAHSQETSSSTTAEDELARQRSNPVLGSTSSLGRGSHVSFEEAIVRNFQLLSVHSLYAAGRNDYTDWGNRKLNKAAQKQSLLCGQGCRQTTLKKM